MKKILLGLGTLLVINSAYAINPESVYGRKFINTAVPTCVKDIMLNDGLMSFEFAKKFCTCSMTAFVSEMSVKDLQKYEQDDPEMEKKADKIIDRVSDDCLEELSK